MDIFAPLGKSLHVSPTAARFIGGGFLLIAAAIYLLSFLGDSDVVHTDPWSVAVYLIGFGLAVLVLSGLPGGARLLLAWLLTVLFSVFLLAVFLQILFQGRMPWAPAPCLLSFGRDASCQIVSTTRTGTPPGEVTLPGTQPTVTTPLADEEKASKTVFVQFAGYPREDVVALSAGLASDGWTVAGADRGGQRIGDAAGLNEVRFFTSGDRKAAEALARAIANRLGTGIEVRDLSETALAARAVPGHIEAWISQ